MKKGVKKITDPMAHLEWELFEWPVEFSHITCLKGFYDLPKDAKVVLSRGENYKLSGHITGMISSRSALEYNPGDKEIEVGDIMEPEQIVGSKTSWETIGVKGVILGSNQISMPKSPADAQFGFNVQAIASEATYTDNGYTIDEVEKVLEFYLCGHIQLSWPGVTRKIEVTKTAKIRLGIEEDLEEPVNIAAQGGGSGADFFTIETAKYFVIVQKADSGYLPDWANGVVVEYRKKDKPIPSEEERKAISEITGFVLGTQLMKIGESQLDMSDIIVKRQALNPWGDNIVAKCSAPAKPPVRIGHIDDWGKVQTLLSKLVPAYIEHREKYNLKDVLWKYWIASDLAIGTNLPILSSGLETLADSYIKANKLIRTYSKDEKHSYRKLVAEELELIKGKLEPFDFKKRVVDKFENPFTIGVGEKLKMFFETLGFKFGNKDIENLAMQARNAMTHGPLGGTDKEIKRYIKLSHAYESLFNRLLLKILGYEGDYTDYSYTGYPSININDNLKGKI